jgi:2-succinyl-5-enolpyruvyl-6-hydroxy-3-cyclohexene-1-carboxylate synthase
MAASLVAQPMESRRVLRLRITLAADLIQHRRDLGGGPLSTNCPLDVVLRQTLSPMIETTRSGRGASHLITIVEAAL